LNAVLSSVLAPGTVSAFVGVPQGEKCIAEAIPANDATSAAAATAKAVRVPAVRFT
jgi:hypothetical protein